MDKLARLTRLHALFDGRRTGLSLDALCERLECSRATAKRAIRELRDESGAPLQFARDRGGYLYVQPEGESRFELPGLWFGADELAGLVTLREMLVRLEPGVVADLLAPLGRRLEALMARRELRIGEAARRVRILSQHARAPGPAFGVVAQAVLSRRCLAFQFSRRIDGRSSERHVSPQRLTRYRGCWYLDGWCHERRGLRSFSLERIERPRLLPGRARTLPETELDAHYADAYGIFAGRATDAAVLRIAPTRARWVADEVWHPRQEGRFLPDGRYELRVPYCRSEELLSDILALGPDVEVVRPEGLRAAVRERLRAALEAYRDGHRPSAES